MRVAFTSAADLALGRFPTDTQVGILHNIQEAVQMCETGTCRKMVKMRREPSMYRIVCGDHRAIGCRFGDTFLVIDVLRRHEKTYRFLR